MAQVIKKAIIRTLLFTLAFVLVLLIGLAAALQVPAIQTLLAQKAASEISKALKFPVSIRYVRIEWLDRAFFEDVLIIDRENKRMIEVPGLSVDFEIASLLAKGNINIDEVILDQAKVQLIKNKKDGTLNMDEFILAINELTRPKDTTRTGKIPVFSIDRVKLENVFFSYADQRKDSIRDGFDYHHITIDSIQATAFNFRLAADTIEIDVDKLTGRDPRTHLDIKQLTTAFRYTKTSMQATDLYALIGNSVIRNFVAFKYAKPSDLSDFNNKVTINAHLAQTYIYSKDLALFAPYLNQYNEKWMVSGDFNGKVTRFRLKDADLRFGKQSAIEGNISFTGLPNFKETFIDLDLLPSVIETSDLQQYIPDASAYHKTRKFGRVSLKGKFLGFPNDFVANGTFETDLGKIVSDINLKLKKQSASSTYSGRLTTYAFNVGKLLGQPDLLQLLDMNGTIKGRGFTIEEAALDVKANVKRLGINKYNYRNIVVNGNLGRQQFKGNVSVNDTNLVFTANGEVDLRNNKNLFDIDADLQRANLQPLHFTSTETSIRTKLNVNFQGLALDDIVGEAYFTDAYLLHQNRDLIVDSIYVFSSRDSVGRILNIDSDFFSAYLHGSFEFSQAFADGKNLLQEYRLTFDDVAAAESYYQRKNTDQFRNYTMNLNADLKDINPLLALFYPPLYVSKNTQVEGAFTSGRASIVSFNTHIDSIAFNNYKFYNSDVDITSSKLADSSNVLAQAYIHSDRQQLGTVPATEDLTVEAIWGNKQIDFDTRIKQTASTNYANLKGALRFFPNYLQLQFSPSHFQILDNEWHITTNNLITIKGRQLTFKDLSVSNRYQMISVNGIVSDSATDAVELTVKDFSLQTLNPILGRDLLGTANGSVIVRDFYQDLNLQSELQIEEFVLDNFLIGDINGQTTWDKVNKLIGVRYQIFRMGNQILTLSGNYDPQAEENALNMQALLNKTDLEILEPFFKSQVSNLGGTATGTLKITGMLSGPLLKGTIAVSNGRFKYNYLNTTYRFADKVIFSENEIGVKQLQLLDDANNIAFVNGGVFHDGFRNFVLDLRFDMREFKVLNTTAKDNDLFYGTAIATGNAEILGSISNLNITANARSNKGTKIFIPISGSSKGIEQQEYIKFVSKSRLATDTTEQVASQQVKLTGLKLDFNFDITPDAYCEIIFDLKAGDIIRGNGNGKIKMQIDTKGDFTMFGDYVITKGFYNFTLLNAINKEFKVNPGSTVSWTGDPYGGILNISASYDQTASLLPILNDPSLEGPEYNRRYPVTVLLNLKGDLLSPDIDLGIKFNDYPQNIPLFRTAIPAYEARLLTDEQELNRQVFSLMVLRKLSPEGAFSGVQGSVGNSVSELLSNQLSYWASQVDENLEIDLDLNGLDEDAFNAFQLRLSYSLFDGRLRVTRDGSFTNAQNQSNTMSVIGDWTVEYMLSKDGKFRVKMYNKNTFNVLSTNMNNTNTIAGFSLLHVQSFNTLKELFYLKKKQSEKPETSEDPAKDLSDALQNSRSGQTNANPVTPEKK